MRSYRGSAKAGVISRWRTETAGSIFRGLAGFGHRLANEFAQVFVCFGQVGFAEIEHVAAAIAFPMQTVF